jgi:hypothetical protein
MTTVAESEPVSAAEPNGRGTLDVGREAALLPRDEMPRWLWWLAPAGLGAVLAFALAQGFFTSDSLTALSVGALTAGSALMVGALLGFLFGIPRTLQGERPPDVLEANGGGTAPEYRVNTNLEQISDWLTKILVGVGLVQLGAIIDALGDLADYIAAGLGDIAAAAAFALGVVVYFAVAGFLLAYLWTRLNLTGAFARAESAAMRTWVDRKLDTIKQNVDERIVGVEQEVAEQQERDVRALSLLERQLDPQSPMVPQTQLDTAIADASPSVKIQLFFRANETRNRTWRKDRALMERTIPIFEALIAADPEHRFHRHFGQLGFALKDKREPDYPRAIEMLSEAIRIRGRGGYRAYEYNRAEAIIRLGGDAELDQAQVDQVVADLRVAIGNSYWENLIVDPNGPFEAWLARHGLTVADLRA